MRNIKIYHKFKSLLVVLLATFLITSCKKNEEENLEPARIFKAGEISVAAGETSAKLKWPVPILSAGLKLNYTVDFSETQDFSNIAFTKVVDTAGITVTDENIKVRIKYYARVKANAYQGQPESKYTISSTFQLSGLQLFTMINPSTIRETSVTLNFIQTAGLTSISLKPVTGNATTVTLTTTDAAAGFKAITGLAPATLYTAELLIGTRSVGIINFTTLATTNYTVVLNSGDDLGAQITSAGNGAVIGLNDGTYNLSTSTNTLISAKALVIKGTSGDPSKVKINFKQFDLDGSGAGITFSGVWLDGTAAAAQYFLNPTATAATFSDIVIDNSIVSNATVSFIRADRATNARDQKIANITVSNSKIYAIGGTSSSYHLFHLSKLEFGKLSITNSTIYDFGPGLIIASTVLTGATMPVISISNCTLNGYGFGGTSRYALLDANTNPIAFTLENSIVTNTPKSASIAAAAVRSSGTGATTTIRNNNFFNFNNALTAGTELTFPTSAVVTNNLRVDLGWSVASTNFALPIGSALRTASTTGGLIGDPRWIF